MANPLTSGRTASNGTSSSTGGQKSSNPWDLSNWTQGPVTFFQALGIKANIQYPKLEPQLAQQAAAITPDSSHQNYNPGQNNPNAAPVAIGSCNAAQVAANKKLGQQLAQQYGWGQGSEWTAFNNVVMAESGWCNTIKNPTSTAYGIGQFLDTTWSGVGLTKTSDAKSQIEGMLKYIKQRYKTPSQAWQFHLANGWY